MRVLDAALERQRELEQEAACDYHERRFNLPGHDSSATREQARLWLPDPCDRPSAPLAGREFQAADLTTSDFPTSNSDIVGSRHTDFAWYRSPQVPFQVSADDISGQQRQSSDPLQQSFGPVEAPFDSLRTHIDRVSNSDEQNEPSDHTEELQTKGRNRRRRRDLGEPWIKAVLDCLGRLNPKDARSNALLVRQGTAMGDPTQSRAGTDMWLPQRDLDSEYMRMYHTFTTEHDGFAATDTAAGGHEARHAPLETNDSGPPAVALLLKCPKAEPMSDAEVARQMSIAMSEMNVFEQAAYVNAQDKNGIAALHLAIAFGFLATCSLLIAHEANHKLTTKENARPHAFALPAERLAGRERDWGLYMRIMLCREHVRYGKRPPVPRLDPKQPDCKRRDRGFRKMACSGRKAAPRATSTSDRAAAGEKMHANELRAVHVDLPHQDEAPEKVSGLDGWPGELDAGRGVPSTPEISMPQQNQYISPISLFPPPSSRPPSSRHTEAQLSTNSARSSFAMDEALGDALSQQPFTPSSIFGPSGPADPSNTDSIMPGTSSNAFPDLPPYEDLYPGSMPFEHPDPNLHGWPEATVDRDMLQDEQNFGFDYPQQRQQDLDQVWNDQFGSYTEQGAQFGDFHGFTAQTLQQPGPADASTYSSYDPPAASQLGYNPPTNNHMSEVLPLSPHLGNTHIPPNFQMSDVPSTVTNPPPPMYEPDAGFWAEAPARPQHNYHYLLVPSNTQVKVRLDLTGDTGHLNPISRVSEAPLTPATILTTLSDAVTRRNSTIINHATPMFYQQYFRMGLAWFAVGRVSQSKEYALHGRLGQGRYIWIQDGMTG